MECSKEQTFSVSSDAFITLGNYRDDASLTVTDRRPSETVRFNGLTTAQLRTALKGYVSGIKYHDHEASAVIEFCKELQTQCSDVLERLDKEQKQTQST